MSAVLVSKENNRAVFTAEIPAEEFNRAIETAYRKNRQHFSIPGFRKGKAPRKLLERNYGENLFYEDALNEVLPNVYENAIKELDLDPVSQPDVDVDDIEKNADVKVKFEVDIKPIPVLGEYKGIDVEITKYEVSDEQVEMKMNEQREANARIIPVADRAAVDGDIATIDYEGFMDDEPFDGGKGEGYELVLGSGSFIPGFEDQVIGHKVGESFSIQVTFPGDYREPMAGKDARFDVTIHALKEKQLPEFDDDFAVDVSDFDTLEEYRADIRRSLQDELDKRIHIEKENAAIEKLIEISEIAIPESMIEYQIDLEYEQMERNMQQMGISMDQYMNVLQTTEYNLRKELRPKAEKRLQADLLLEALKDKLEIAVSEEEFDAKVEELTGTMQEDKREDYRKFLMESQKEGLTESIKIQKAIEMLVADMNFVEVEHAHDHDHSQDEQTEDDSEETAEENAEG